MKFKPYQTGYTLLELMIALALSAFLLTGVIVIFADSRQTDNLSSSLSRIQETGRTALDILSKDIRMAGYQGCADPESIPIRVNVPVADTPLQLGQDGAGNNFASMLEQGVRGFEVANANWAINTPYAGTNIANNALQGSDVLIIHRGANSGIITPSIDMADTSSPILINNPPVGPFIFGTNNLIMISDCENVDLFRVTNNPANSVSWLHAQGANDSNLLSNPYSAQNSTSIMEYRHVIYFVGQTARRDEFNNPINALYRATNLNRPNQNNAFDIEELLEGVDSLQLLYGLELATGNTVFDFATNINANNQWALVDSVRVGLLMSTPNNPRSTDDNNTYALPGQDIVAAIIPDGTPANGVQHRIDRRLRRDFINTISVRNRR